MDQDQTQEQEVYGIAANNGGKPPVRLREPTPEGRAYNIVTISKLYNSCLLYTSPSPRDVSLSRMPSSA